LIVTAVNKLRVRAGAEEATAPTWHYSLEGAWKLSQSAGRPLLVLVTCEP